MFPVSGACDCPAELRVGVQYRYTSVDSVLRRVRAAGAASARCRCRGRPLPACMPLPLSAVRQLCVYVCVCVNVETSVAHLDVACTDAHRAGKRCIVPLLA